MSDCPVPHYLITEAGGAHDDWATHNPPLVAVFPLTPALGDLVRSADAAIRSAYALAHAAGATSASLFFAHPPAGPDFVNAAPSDTMADLRKLDGHIPDVRQEVWDNHLLVARGSLQLDPDETAALAPDSLILHVTYDGSDWPHFTWQAAVDPRCAMGDWAGAGVMTMDLLTPELLTGHFADVHLSPAIVADLAGADPSSPLLSVPLPANVQLDLRSLWVRRPSETSRSIWAINGIHVDACIQEDGTTRWAIRSGDRNILGRDGQWNFDPNPSSRTDEYYDLYRFDSLPAALAFALDSLADEFIVRLPVGFVRGYVDHQPICAPDITAARIFDRTWRKFWAAYADAELLPVSNSVDGTGINKE